MDTILGELPSEEERKRLMPSDLTADISNKSSILDSALLFDVKDERRFHFAVQTVLIECLETILDHSMLPEVMKISHLSRAFRKSVLDYLRQRIDSHLRTWFTDSAGFRNMLRATSSIVSGSTVLSFALGVDWGVQDLDIYVGAGTIGVTNPVDRCAKLLEYLVEVEGYQPQAAFGDASDVRFSGIIPTIAPIEYDKYGWVVVKSIFAVYKLSKTRSVPGQKEPITVHIDVINGRVANPTKIISEFHSTQVMNWVSADNITITYPVLTFTMRGAVNWNRASFSGPTDTLWWEKYAARGFKIFESHNAMDILRGTSWAALVRGNFDLAACMRMPYGQGSEVDQFNNTC
ncbi:hypothetical protein M407DRAFT_98185 [Tulasnella calospora MUT 4182]|uniref:Uncharacterized protein n=1 Tax=Tulasnella calospora MUT 4182 TaxID=1051891 RepID=A0A0C3KTJ9_9AGAM|nr:hypothetical protein M407DRAFT_98185 [Tulasnella calospora MUT 4182]